MGLKIKDMPCSERPIERIFSLGPKALSESELLAIILRTGTKKENVLDISRRLFSIYNLKEMSRLGAKELSKNHGLGDVKSAQIMACFELARRIASFREEKYPRLSKAGDVVKMFSSEMSTLKKEHFIGVYLDSRMNLIKSEILFIGSLDSSVVHPREVFQVALKESAASVIILHNHPSGGIEPSDEDLDITQQMAKAGEIMGIPLLDHIIIAKNSFLSFKEKGYL